jgi:hypothetical protein
LRIRFVKIVAATAWFALTVTSGRVALAQGSSQGGEVVVLYNSSASPATITLPDGRSCTAPGKSTVRTNCDIENVQDGTYQVTITSGGQSASYKLFVSPPSFIDVTSTCSESDNGKAWCSTN